MYSKKSVVDTDPTGSVLFGRIRIVKCENGSETVPGSEKNDQKYENIIGIIFKK